MSLPRYEKYKDSGVEWIGEIPEGWEVKRLKFVVSKVGSGVTPKGGANVYQLDGIPLLRSQNIHFDALKLDDVAYISQEIHDEMQNSKVMAGDVLLNITGASIGRCYFSDVSLEDANVNQHVCIIRPTSEIGTKYLYYLLRSDIGQKQIDVDQTGSGREGLNFELLKNFLLPLADNSEQTAIASFLDRKTAEIDQLIANKEKLIALYEEEKAAIINRAVTKGLDLKLKTKPSGVDWLGDIPEHWEVKRLKYVASMKSGEGITSDKIKESGDYPVYGGNGLRGYFDSFTHEGVYVLIGRQGALCGNINYASGKFWASEHAIVCTMIGNYEVKWFGGLLKAMNLNQYSVSAAQPGLSVENIKILQIPVPPQSEQTAIVAHIEAECSRLDAIIDKFKRQIELFKEYRATLISEVVTGKIDVRDEVAA
ncbi:MAG: restriction endonuclease subunit S [Desulfobulbus sp.]|jgi:type I restriction enzyme S subunit